MPDWDWQDVVTEATRGVAMTQGRGYAPLQEVRAYWEGLRPEGGIPDRAAIDPRGMEMALEHVFLLERIGPGIARFRVSGMHLTALMGMEIRGMPLTSLLEPGSRSAAESLMEEVFSGPAVVEMALRARTGLGRGALEGRMILLPLREAEVCNRALGCLVTLGPVGRTPRRFDIIRQRTETLRPGAPSEPAGSREMAGFAEAAARFEPKAGTARSRAHLRLVKSDER